MKLIIRATTRDQTGGGWTTFKVVEMEISEQEYLCTLAAVKAELAKDNIPIEIANLLTSLSSLLDRCKIQSY